MKYSKEIVEKIAGYIRLGMRNEDAARIAGVAEATFYEWKKSKAEFSEALKGAEDQGEASNLAIIHKAKTKQWTAAAWLLERRHPEKYSVRRIELSGPNGKPLAVHAKNENRNIDVTGIKTADLEKLLAHVNAKNAEAKRSLED